MRQLPSRAVVGVGAGGFNLFKPGTWFSRDRAATPSAKQRAAVLPRDLILVWGDNAALLTLFYSPSTGQVWRQHGAHSYLLVSQTIPGIAIDYLSSDGRTATSLTQSAFAGDRAPWGQNAAGQVYRFHPTTASWGKPYGYRPKTGTQYEQ